jgi:TonB family protein
MAGYRVLGGLIGRRCKFDTFPVHREEWLDNMETAVRSISHSPMKLPFVPLDTLVMMKRRPPEVSISECDGALIAVAAAWVDGSDLPMPRSFARSCCFAQSSKPGCTAYPELARSARIEGAVKVMVAVAANGRPTSTKVVGGHPVLAKAAVDAIEKWKWVRQS